MKSLRSHIAVITLVSISLISGLVIWVSLQVYEGLYEDFVSEQLTSLTDNITVDLLPYMNEEPGNFSIVSILLRLDEYENVEFAQVYNAQGTLISSYTGQSTPHLRLENTPYHSIDSQKARFELDYGLNIEDGHIQIVKMIGNPQLVQGKLVLSYNIENALAASRRDFTYSTLPFVLTILIFSLFIVLELQRRSLLPLFKLIAKMRHIEKTKDYAVAVNIEGKSEIRALTRGFNNMMSDISQQTEQINQKNRLLTRQQAQMEKLANFDPLTGLPNRQFLMKSLSIELARAKRHERDVAILFLDLDGFKMVNDSFGHDVGDKLLCEISDEITTNLREGDIVGRLGGDEFVVILSDEVSLIKIEEIAQRLVDTLSTSHIVEQWKLETGVSIGIAMAKDCDYDPVTLISNADVAMYHAKRCGRSQYTLFTRIMQDDNQRMLRIATSIYTALENNEFFIAYQPKVDENGSVKSLEALLRWYNPHFGIVSPGEFIPIAEQSDKISAITTWVISQVCKDVPHILAKHGYATTVSLNLSASDLQNEKLIQYALSSVEGLGPHASAIEFEITESAFLKNFQSGNTFFEQVRKIGCKIALDDFGTGYSSLSYLTEFNIDTLKIDQQFVNQIGKSERSELITVTIIDMAKNLNLSVCAEGVETPEQARFLIEHGCELLQGYYYGKPEPLETSQEIELIQ
ncbi:EAL domain-containing protein [Alteromonas sp. 14N.309.X.WAT.G.H12]|uniref:EAL domain-containing protein n=1 Tax=Alteromonas sp. 14N.309.X.WAT.G.H12 TaxID=3120824 RepID=UPI002FD5DAD8